MLADLSNFKVIYNNKVLRAMFLNGWEYGDNPTQKGEQECFKTIEVAVLNEEGQLVSINDEARKFQFIPVVK